MTFGVFRQDRFYPKLFQPGSDAVQVAPQLYDKEDLVASEPGLYAFEQSPYAIGYVTITPYNAEAD